MNNQVGRSRENDNKESHADPKVGLVRLTHGLEILAEGEEIIVRACRARLSFAELGALWTERFKSGA